MMPNKVVIGVGLGRSIVANRNKRWIIEAFNQSVIACLGVWAFGRF